MTDKNMPGVLTDLGPIRENTKQIAYEVVKAAAAAGHQLYFVWGIGGTGDHKNGIALDFMVYDKGEGVDHPGPERPEVGRFVRDYLWANRVRLGVRYLIFSHQIISRTGTPPNVELPYTAMVNGKRDPHTNHVHCSLFPPSDSRYRTYVALKPKVAWPSKGWATLNIKGKTPPWANGRAKASTDSKIKFRRTEQGWNMQYTSLVKNSEGTWARTRYGTYYLLNSCWKKGKL